MILTLLAALALTANAASTQQATWYFLRYFPPTGHKFTSLTGEMVIPALPTAATYYLWPGLQPADSSGVYQNVLDGRSGSWWFGSGWCCSNPNLLWGGGFHTQPGDTVSFANTLNPDGLSWTSRISHPVSGKAATNIFALATKNFTQALFAIELDGPSWDFGQLAFKDVEITATGSSTSWCTQTPENYAGRAIYSVSGVSMSVGNNTVTCAIRSLILQRPAE